MVSVKDVTVLKELTTDISKVQLRSDGVIKVIIKEGAEVDLAASRQIFQNVSSFAAKKELLVLVVGGMHGSVSKEARDFAGSDEASSVTIAEAVVTPSLPQKLFVNFLLRFYNPKRELKLFNTEEGALEWLYSLKEKHGLKSPL
ncbi:MAG: hypothetical protein K0S44_1054 [Bacteroidetes bacterium]|jgi:hypothetical protein|nr:hypothetical protein [Bacteroidota bacterium]